MQVVRVVLLCALAVVNDVSTSTQSHSHAGGASSKDPSTSKPTTAHTRAVRRNIRGETPLHVAAIKVSLVPERCVV